MNAPARKTIRKSLSKNRRGVEMAEVAVTMTGIAIAGAGAVKALGVENQNRERQHVRCDVIYTERRHPRNLASASCRRGVSRRLSHRRPPDYGVRASMACVRRAMVGKISLQRPCAFAHPSTRRAKKLMNIRNSVRKSLSKNRRGVEMAEVAVTMVGIAIAGAGAVKALGSKIKTVNDNTSATM